MQEGIVEQVNSKATRTGGKSWSAKIDGKWWNTGFDKPNFTEGDRIKFGTVQNGQYTNMDPDNVEVLEAGAAPALQRDASGIGPVDRRTVLHASRGSAIELAAVLVQAEAVKLPAKEGGKYEVLTKLVDDLVVTFYQQGIAVMKDEWPFGDAANGSGTDTPEE